MKIIINVNHVMLLDVHHVQLENNVINVYKIKDLILILLIKHVNVNKEDI